MSLTIDATYKLLREACLIRERSEIRYQLAEVAVLRNRARLATSCLKFQAHAQRHVARQLHATIHQRINEGRLPHASAERYYGAPGDGGCCDACDKDLASTQLVMSVPWPSRKTFAHLHADCFMAWRAVIHAAAALACPVSSRGYLS